MTVQPEYPIVLIYDDWELASFADEDDFLNHSGCEEVDFHDGLDTILDARGRALSFDYRTCVFTDVPNRSVSVDELAARIQKHVEGYKAQGSHVEMTQFPSDDIGTAVRFAYRIILATNPR